jgi:MFS transporter, OFA family, oxalate/formate antiporter
MGIATNMSQFYLVLPVIVIMSTIVFPIGTKLSLHFGSKGVILIGGLFATIFCGFSTFATNIYVFFLLYAVGFGIGKGFLYPAPLNAGWSHLPARKGFVSGIVVSGMGVGAFLFSLITKQVINPDNV